MGGDLDPKYGKRDADRLDVTPLETTLTALPPLLETPLGNSVPSAVLLRLLDAVLRDAEKHTEWWFSLGDTRGLPVPARLAAQWRNVPAAITRAADLTLRLQGSRRRLNGEANLRTYLDSCKLNVRNVGAAATALLGEITDTYEHRARRAAPPPKGRSRRVSSAFAPARNRARFRQTMGEK